MTSTSVRAAAQACVCVSVCTRLDADAERSLDIERRATLLRYTMSTLKAGNE